MSLSDRTTGFYGKLPHLGDFVTRRLPSQLIQPWDRWLRECMAASQSQLGEAWLGTYLTSPLWRFVLTPGIAGQDAWMGVLMPSVDRVGRYFPLTLAAPVGAPVDSFGLISANEWFDAAESLALTCLDDGFELDAFDARVMALAPPDLPASAPVQSASRADAWHLSVPTLENLASAYPTMLSRALEDVFFAYSLWWSAGSDQVAPSFLVCQGLPPPDGYACLLAGDWAGRGWRTLN
jgi:type VI secretion system protein ImpM